MFKKVLSLVLVLVLCFSMSAALTSCGENDFRVALICLHGKNSTYDKNFIDAFKTACANVGIKNSSRKIVVNIPEDTACYDKAAQFADRGYDLVFADSFGHEPYIIQAAKEFPDVQFCHATGNGAHTEELSNFHD
ncbi:MAG: BMP family ABC transporter substrate-binding protein, partial [Clostridia bacterium]|nr:BMP family ABC transporter substrate-binding protein [Clostridia bacterium]